MSKRFGAWANVVEDLNLDIGAGEFLTLLGPSGSGKSTTLMMLAGFEKPTDGDILVEGQSVVAVPPNRRGIGMVFQSYALFPHMTVAQNVAFPLKVKRRGGAETADRTRRILSMVGLESIADRLPAQLSGGQQQRVAVARALVFEPRIVLMDEPLAALDKQLRERMQLEIRTLHDKVGVTTVYVTHDQTEALTMSDRIAVFDGGRVQQVGSPNEIYERPANAFVAGFIGDNNILPGTVAAREEDHVVVDLGGGVQVRAPAATGEVTGASVSVAIRPERVAVGGSAGDLQSDGDLQAVVDKVIYVGDRLRLHLRLPGGQAIAATMVETSHTAALRSGDTVPLALPSAYCQLFAREG